MQVSNILNEHKLVAILRNVPLEKLIKTVEAINKGGVKLIEVTLNSPDALEGIKALREHFKDEVCIGAGTVLNKEDCQKAVEAGASFLLSPGVSKSLLKYCQKNDVFVVPGFMTPSEAMMALKYGFKHLKLFPAINADLSYVKNLKGPLNNLEIMAVGGVNLENIPDFKKAGCQTFGIGSQLADLKLIENEDWEEITNRARTYVEAVGA